MLVLLALLAAACGAPTRAGVGASDRDGVIDAAAGRAPKLGGKMVYGIEADPNGLDPSKNGWDASGLLLANAIYDPIAAFDAAGSVKPYLAESIAHNDDFTVWDVRLRAGVTFHDGSPLTSLAVKANLEHHQESKLTGPASRYLDHAEIVDDLTARIVLHERFAAFPIMLTGQGGLIPAPGQFAKDDASTRPVGTGPFAVSEWQIGTRLLVKKNQHYWRAGLPYLDEIEFRPIADSQTRASALTSGDVDIVHSSSNTLNQRLDQLQADGRVQVVRSAGEAEESFAMFNLDRPPFDDIRARQAVAYATDPAAYLRATDGDVNRVADGPYSADSTWHAAVAFPHADQARARALVASYEQDHGPLVVDLATASSPESQAGANVLAEQWTRAGVKVTVKTYDQTGYIIAVVLGHYDVAMWRLFSSPDPDGDAHWWQSASASPSGQISVNMARLRDPEIDKALADGRHTDDLAARHDAYTHLQQRFAELVPYVWLEQVQWVIAARSRVHGIENGPLPDGSASQPMAAGVHRLATAWIDA